MVTNTIFFSIIVPTFNTEKDIKKCMESLIYQDFNLFEIIIIDNCSEDNTLKELYFFAERFQQIKIFSEKDSGIYDAMNKGITKALGRWLLFLGSDDELDNNQVLKNVYEKIKDTNYDWVYGYSVIKETNKKFEKKKKDIYSLYTVNICHQSIFYTKTIFHKIGNYNTRYNLYADWDLNIRCMENTEISHSYINICISKYSMGGTSTKYKFTDKEFLKDKLYPFLLRYNSSHNIFHYILLWKLLNNFPIDDFIEYNFHKANKNILYLLSHVQRFRHIKNRKIKKIIMIYYYFFDIFILRKQNVP
ncbi:MAG: glycosyltransferase family 2 protein [Chitinophagaceae bacterium]|nr:glycosyltransferase family 2 protein [Chitinophagaceae bacterium]